MKIIKIALEYIKKYSTPSCLVFCFIAISSLFEGASFGMLIPLIQNMTGKGADIYQNISGLRFLKIPANQTEAISLIFITIFVLVLIKNIFLYLSNLLIAKLRFGIISDLRINFMNNLLDYNLGYFDRVKTGQIISVMSVETRRMGDFILAMLQFGAIFARILVYIVILFLISWKACLVIFPLFAIVLIPIELIMKRLKRLGKYISQAFTDYNYKLTEILGGVRLIKSCATEAVERNDFKNVAEKVSLFQYKNNKNVHLIIPLAEISIFGLITLCFLILLNVIKIDIIATFPFIATYLLVLIRGLTQLNTMNSYRSACVSRLAAFTHYNKMYTEQAKESIKDGSRKIDKFNDAIEFKNVYFSYNNSKEVLRNIHLKIPKGKMTALVGASGSGKSTIVNLILRFYEIDSGAITVDGVDLRELKLNDWRKKIGFVSQDIFIFNTTVRDNIAYGLGSISEDHVINVAKSANAHEFIMQLPDTYNTILGERGARLSGGEKQRISIARALIHNPEILILDEATSSLDTQTERLIKQALDCLTKDRTVIAIAHRLSTILYADDILVLDKGEIIERGKHAQLLHKNGLYKKLYQMQFSV